VEGKEKGGEETAMSGIERERGNQARKEVAVELQVWLPRAPMAESGMPITRTAELDAITLGSLSG
jgi:hypothetical protein